MSGAGTGKGREGGGELHVAHVARGDHFCYVARGEERRGEERRGRVVLAEYYGIDGFSNLSLM